MHSLTNFDRHSSPGMRLDPAVQSPVVCWQREAMSASERRGREERDDGTKRGGTR